MPTEHVRKLDEKLRLRLDWERERDMARGPFAAGRKAAYVSAEDVRSK
jgi:hypothetical protein